MKKKFKCYIHYQRKHYITEDLKSKIDEVYGPNLGYYYDCAFIGHPTFGTTSWKDAGHTSLVIKETELKNGDLKIETLNSIYKIKKSDRT